MSAIGKIGVRSGGPAGCIVPGLSGGSGSPGRSGSRFTQWVGISDSGSRYLTTSSLTRLLRFPGCGAILWREQPPDECGDLGGLLVEPSPCDANHAIAGRLQDGITLAVIFERPAIAVEL